MRMETDETTQGGMTPTHGVWIVIGTAAAGLVILGVLFRRTKARD
jgi:hypothetical protein